MLKKLLVLLLIALMTICMISCGGGDTSSDEATDPAAETTENTEPAEDTEQAADSGIVEFSDKIVADNDYVTIELDKFYEKEVNWAGSDGPVMEKYVSFKITNNSDKELYINLQDAYIGDEQVRVIMQDGNVGPAAGKSGTYSYDIQYDTTPDPTPLESLEDLNALEGEFEIALSDGNNREGKDPVKFKIEDVVNGTSSVEETSSATESEYMTIDGVYVDNSYSTKESDSMRFLYICYTAHTDSENLKIDCKSMKITINDTNTYEAVRSKSQVRYMRNYYNGAYLKTVNIGESMKFVETFEIPEAELAPGRSIKISKSQIPGSDSIVLSTDDIVFCDSAKKVAKAADPKGYKKERRALQDADSDVVAAVQSELNGYKWDVSANDIFYQIEFYAPNSYELRTSINTSSGTYTVKKGYIICENDIGGKIEIPYTYKDGKVKVDMTAAFDMMA